MLNALHQNFEMLNLPVLLLLGGAILISYFAGKAARAIKLPSVIGFMLAGVILGPSITGAIGDHLQEELGFITEIALGFVAFSIGLELSFSTLKRQGIGILSVIFAESFGAFIAVSAAVYFFTKDPAIALIFGAMAPASAPAGTVAVIKEFRARGSLTKALYAVVGFDDGLAIIIFGFAAAFARIMLERETGAATSSLGIAILVPFKEIILSIIVGLLIATILCILLRHLKDARDMLILVFAFILVVDGLCTMMHLSLIMTNMVVGITVTNTQKTSLIENVAGRLGDPMAILFILFFMLAGAHLHIELLPSLGLLGLIYIIFRSMGKIIGARIGAMVGSLESKIKKYVGIGILAQAGVAIGLALIVKHDFAGVGKVIDETTGKTMGDEIGMMILTTITVTCIIFEIIGPILTRYALDKAGEIPHGDTESRKRIPAIKVDDN